MHVSFQEYQSVSNRIELNQIVSNGIESMLNCIESIFSQYWIDVDCFKFQYIALSHNIEC